MNALTVISVAVLAACSSAQLLGYPGYHPGFYAGAYSGYYPGAYSAFPGAYYAGAPAVTFKSVAPKEVTLKTVAAPAPLTYNVAPFAPVAPIQSQYHSQDEIGQYSFGYAGGPSSRAETRDAFGIVRGSYNYIDAEGEVQTNHYVADALGFRVSATNLPVAPDAPEAAPLALPGPLPEPVQDTPEVAAAKAVHKAAYDEAAAAAAAAPDSRKKRSIVAPAFTSPLRFSYGFSAPLQYRSPFVYGAPAGLTYNAPLTYTAGAPLTYTAAATAAVKDASLLRVVHNPGHATSYRVD